MLGAKIEGHHHGDDDHGIVRANVATEGQDRKHGDYHHGHDGFHLDEAGQVLFDGFHINIFSHEFKTPIVSIRGFARRLRSGNLTQEQQEEYLQFIAEESERLSKLASSILLIAKYENQALIADQTEYDLDEQIRTCILRMESQWSERNIVFDVDLPRLPYRNNAEMMDYVWGNLIGNAIKYSHDNGKIHISARMEDSFITVWIRDEGIGIRQEHLRHIFDKFYQADTAHASAGNGLGLALVRRIIELSKGEIFVESQENHGTVFIVRLPLQQC